MTLRERRVLFSRLVSQLVLWIFEQGWEVAYDEVRIITPRAARRGVERLTVDDAMHIRNSFHYLGLAADLNLYIDGQYISDGDHPVWERIAEHWESLNPLCTAGLRFANVDANHVSLGEKR